MENSTSEMTKRIFRIIDDRDELKDADLARHIGATKAAVSRWRNGLANPSSKYTALIAEYLGVTQDYLSTGKEADGLAELDGVYLSLAREASQNNIDPEDIRMAIKMIKDIREKETQS